MNFGGIIVGILAALLAPVVIGIAMAGGALLSLVQLIEVKARTARKPSTSPSSRASRNDAEVVKMPERGGRVEEFRPAA
jgi:hypothetical protein